MHFKLHNTGINDLPPGLPGITTLKHLETAFPNSDMPATVVIKADDIRDPAVQTAVAELRQQAIATGAVHEPICSSYRRDAHRRRALDAAGRERDQPCIQDALTTLRDNLIPATFGSPGQRQRARHAARPRIDGLRARCSPEHCRSCSDSC